MSAAAHQHASPDAYDVLVAGGGAAGVAAAVGAAQVGARTLLVERTSASGAPPPLATS